MNLTERGHVDGDHQLECGTESIEMAPNRKEKKKTHPKFKNIYI